MDDGEKLVVHSFLAVLPSFKEARKSDLHAGNKPTKVFSGGLGGSLFQKKPPKVFAFKVLTFDFTLLVRF